MEIKVKCERPKDASGEYKFSRFEDLFYWLTHIKSLRKDKIGGILYLLAKNGYYTGGTGRFFVDIHSDFKKDYFLIIDLGYKSGLLKTRNLEPSVRKDNALALQFARELDNLSKGAKES